MTAASSSEACNPVLTADAVNALVSECLFAQEEPRDGAVMVEGIVATYGFHPGRLKAAAGRIRALLDEMPEEFHAASGEGWTFLNACVDRRGRQWTGEHRAMEALFCLGIGAGAAKWLLPRDMWDAFPGGMPFVVVLAKGADAKVPPP